MSKSGIVELIDKFISKEDTSTNLANEIEVAIDEAFPDDDYMQDVVVMLASYRPGGGDYLYDEYEIIDKLKKLKYRL